LTAPKGRTKGVVDLSGQPKAALRRRFRALRRRLPPAQRQRVDSLAQARLIASPAFATAARVALYRPFDGEPATADVAAAARAAGKQVLYARFARNAALTFVEPRAWTLVRGVPQPDGPAFDLAAGDLLVVPGLAFDFDGFRLGLGGGHYDRTLAHSPALPVGFAYERQRVGRLPRADWDRPVAALVTERSLYTFTENRS
jgi:5-formyltetrahydrofolate cyclo-ligase